MKKPFAAIALIIAATFLITLIPTNSDAFFGFCKPKTSCGGYYAASGCGYGGGYYGGYGWGGYGRGGYAGGWGGGLPVNVGVGWGTGYYGGGWYGGSGLGLGFAF